MTNQDVSPVKLTVTFNDGHTKDFDVFLAVVAENLIPALKVEGRIAYKAPVGGFTSHVFSAVAADTPVVAGLLAAISNLQKAIVDNMDVQSLLCLLATMETLGHTETTLFKDIRTVYKDISGN